jgi:hypothetical protein
MMVDGTAASSDRRGSLFTMSMNVRVMFAHSGGALKAPAAIERLIGGHSA